MQSYQDRVDTIMKQLAILMPDEKVLLAWLYEDNENLDGKKPIELVNSNAVDKLEAMMDTIIADIRRQAEELKNADLL